MSSESSSNHPVSDIQEHTITCIGCSMECEVCITVKDGEIISVEGNNCPTGEMHARSTLSWIPSRD